MTQRCSASCCEELKKINKVTLFRNLVIWEGRPYRENGFRWEKLCEQRCSQEKADVFVQEWQVVRGRKEGEFEAAV